MPVYVPHGNSHPNLGDMRQSMQDETFLHNAYTGGGFSFQKKHGRIDWRKLAAVDVDKISRDVDVQMLQDNVELVAFCDIDSELSLQGSDANLRKLFKLAQLLIEYLLHSQEYLQGYINQTDAQMQKFIQDQTNLQTELDKKNNTYRSLKREYQKSKKLISEYQLMLRAGASGMHKCTFCSKSFLNDEFLKSHILRRHADQTTQLATPGFQKTMGIAPSAGQPSVSANNEELVRELNLITTKLQETESHLIAEREERDRKDKAVSVERDIELKKLHDFSKSQLTAKDQEISELKVIIEKHNEMFTREINNLRHERNLMQKDFDDLRNSQATKPSMLGNLQDESVEERHEKEIARIKEELQRELNASYQEEVRKLRNREDVMKKTYNEEIEKIKLRLKKYENAFEIADAEKKEHGKYIEELEKGKQSMNDQTIVKLQKRLLELEEKIDSQPSRFVDDDLFEETSVQQQQQMASSTPLLKLSLDVPRDVQDSDDNLVLYVASNSKNSFRVWKNPSRNQSEWKDSFNFKASPVEKGQFNVPIYVYYASGSPYWRQYLSRSSKPPRSSYKLDFIFYVSDVQLMGTIKLHVLQTGSGEVVKSMISKSEIYPNWKQVGLSFFVMKGPTFQGMGKSVSFQSTIDESEVDSADEVSVSSYTGTEDARKNLAVAIAKSREDVELRAEEEEVNAISKEDTLAGRQEIEKEDDENDNDEDLSFDEADGKQTTTGSTSQWGSTLLQSGSFLPFPNNPLAIARYNHTQEMIESCREAAIDVLNSNLERRGIDVDASGMINEQFASRMKLHVNEVNTLAKEQPDAISKRKRLMDTIDELARERLGVTAHVEESKSPDKSRSKFKSAVNKIKNATIFGRTSPRKKEDAKHKLKDSGSRPSSFISEPPSPKTPKLSQSDHNIEELGPTPQQRSISKQERESDGNDEIFDDVSENVKFDSDESEVLSDDSLPPAGGTAQLPKVTVTQPGKSDYEPSRVPMRQPRGEKVRALTASLEASLMARQGIKKPAGAIDIHGTEESEDVAKSREQGNNGHDVDFDDDDDDDFDLSSLDEEGYQDFARPKSNADGSKSTAFRPSTQPRSTPKLPAQKTSIMKYSDEDFDSDIDL